MDLEPDQVYTTVYGVIVQLDHRVEGDGSQWNVYEWSDHNHRWLSSSMVVEPSDLLRQTEDPSS